MKILSRTFFFLISAASLVHAQNERYLISQAPRLRAETVFQRWSIDTSLSIWEFSTPVEFYYPFNRQSSMAVNAGFATAGGENVEPLTGLSDAQVSFNYQPGMNNLVFNLGVNLPVGKREMPHDEYNTMAALSLYMFRFRIPVLSQGFGFSPGMTYALPLGEKAVLGFGAAYQLKSAYEPVDEVILTGGVDVQLGEADNLSGDLLFAHYSADKVKGDEIYHAGNKIILVLNYQKAIGQNALLVSALYRNRAKNRIYILADSTEEADQLQPNEIEIMGMYRMFISNRISWKGSADMRILLKTGDLPNANVFELGIGPEWTASPKLLYTGNFKLALCKIKDVKTLTGIGLNAGIVYRF
jgi:hypothetical protein